MTVNPDELLIFKMRGMVSVKKVEVVSEEEAPAPAPEAPLEAEMAARPAAKEAKQRRPLFAPRPKPAPKAPAPPPQLSPYESEESKKLRELELLERNVSLYANPPKGLEAEEAAARGGVEIKVETNAFARVTGMLFLFNMAILGYFVYPQTPYLVNYVIDNGPSALLGLSYEYSISLANLLLAVFCGLSGLLMIANRKGGHMLTGAVGSALLLMISYEYLNTGVVYLLIVNVVAFAGIVSLAYARMSAVSVMESESISPQNVKWPGIETF